MATVIRRYSLNTVSNNFSNAIGPAYLGDNTTPSIFVDLSLDNTITNYAADSDEYQVSIGYSFESELSSPPSPNLSTAFVEAFPVVINRAYTFVSGADNGEYYIGGAYGAAATDANLTDSSQTTTFGTANSPYGAHAFIVAGGAGTASGGTGTVELRVSGTSMADDGTRTASDAEVIVADVTTLAVDDYVQTTRRWIGQVIWTLQNSSGSTHTTFTADFNYGLASVDNFRNSQFRPLELQVGGYANVAATCSVAAFSRAFRARDSTFSSRRAVAPRRFSSAAIWRFAASRSALSFPRAASSSTSSSSARFCVS